MYIVRVHNGTARFQTTTITTTTTTAAAATATTGLRLIT